MGEYLKAVNQFVNPQVGPPTMPTPAVSSGQLTPEQAASYGITPQPIPGMPQMPQSGIDRYLPLLSGIGAGLATPSALQGGSTAMGIGRALQGYAQGRAFQNQAQRQMYQPYIAAMAQRAIIEQQAQSMEGEAARREADGDTKGAEGYRQAAAATRMGPSARYAIPQPARPLTKLQQEKIESDINVGTARAEYYRRPQKEPTGTTPGERQATREQNAVDKALGRTIEVYNKSEASKLGVSFPEWIDKDPVGNATLRRFGAMEGAPLSRMMSEAQSAIEEYGTAPPTTTTPSLPSVNDIIQQIPERAPTRAAAPPTPPPTPTPTQEYRFAEGGPKPTPTPARTPSTREQVSGIVADFQRRDQAGETIGANEIIATLTPLVGPAVAQQLFEAMSRAVRR